MSKSLERWIQGRMYPDRRPSHVDQHAQPLSGIERDRPAQVGDTSVQFIGSFKRCLCSREHYESLRL
jgi:hypothetical protein